MNSLQKLLDGWDHCCTIQRRQLRFHFPKIVELITKTVRALRPLLYDSKNETVFIRVCNLIEFFIGKYNDLNIVWFWRFITSLQTYHTMKTKLVEQSPKFVLNAIQYMKSTADIFSSFIFYRIGKNSQDVNSVKKTKTSFSGSSLSISLFLKSAKSVKFF